MHADRIRRHISEEVGITSLTIATVAVIVFGVLNPRGYGRALALGGATPVGAALVVGAVAVPTFYAVAIGALVGVGLGLLRATDTSARGQFLPVPASRQLVLLVVLSVLVTLTAPLLFDGLAVLNPSGAAATLRAGVLTKSNLAQIAYLVLSVVVVAYLARSRWTGPELIGTAVGLATLLSFWSWTHTSAGVPFPVGVFDNSPAFAFIQTAPGGLLRVRGIFSEPAGLATSCLVTIAYAVSRLWSVRGLRRLGLLVVGSMALFLGSISTSTTFVVAGVALAVIAILVGTATFVLRRGSLSRAAVAALCAAAIASLWLLPVVANAIGQQVSDKVSSSSYTDRSSADSFSYDLVVNTFGFGTGLGSNRASSFVASLLSTVGVVGALLLLAAVVTLVRRGWGVRQARPAVWALTALLICKVVSGPDLSDNSGVLWMSLGVLAHAAVNVDVRRARRFVTASGSVPGGPDGAVTQRVIPSG
ncbi:hypothetical protein [Modestobacter muralis]|uniref:hypothetical protein n=1 Tax=Modestobacter muralis TaxID=1608614 RepID=UPI001B8C8054|nr:hypothetical protein [Modestobacter muralis]